MGDGGDRDTAGDRVRFESVWERSDWPSGSRTWRTWNRGLQLSKFSAKHKSQGKRESEGASLHERREEGGLREKQW